MRLLHRIRLGQVALLFGVGGAGIALGEITGIGLLAAIPATIAGLWATRAWASRAVGRENARLVEAVAAGRTDDALTLSESLRDAYVDYPEMLGQLRVNEAAILARAGRNAEAVRVLESVDPNVLAPAWRPWLQTNLAFSLAEEGYAERALPLARESLALSAELGEKAIGQGSLEAAQLGTFGICLVKTGAHTEARAPLERAIALGGSPIQTATRAYYLGEALRGLGHVDDARASFERALQEAPESDYGARARVARDALAAYR